MFSLQAREASKVQAAYHTPASVAPALRSTPTDNLHQFTDIIQSTQNEIIPCSITSLEDGLAHDAYILPSAKHNA